MPAPKPLELVTVEPPPSDQRVRRDARFALPGEKRTRYSLPTALESGSPVGYRTRVGMTQAEGKAALKLLSLAAPTGFGPAEPVRESERLRQRGAHAARLLDHLAVNRLRHRECCVLYPRHALVPR